MTVRSRQHAGAQGVDHPHEHDHSHEHDHPHGHGHEHPSGVQGFLHGLFVPHSHDAADSMGL
ncbi:MAG TPA: hypothetical protein VLJ88_16850 [Propionibacteriaceae bacterium]|nr:hypothetical protein [Propionibacteriaceae bacterium]